MGVVTALFFGRAFDLPDGRIILPCFSCGTPLWGVAHTCIGRAARDEAAATEARFWDIIGATGLDGLA